MKSLFILLPQVVRRRSDNQLDGLSRDSVQRFAAVPRVDHGARVRGKLAGNGDAFKHLSARILVPSACFGQARKKRSSLFRKSAPLPGLVTGEWHLRTSDPLTITALALGSVRQVHDERFSSDMGLRAWLGAASPCTAPGWSICCRSDAGGCHGTVL